MPHSFFEVEHSTDIIHSLGKFTELQDFNARMYIVADERRNEEFKEKYAFAMFEDLYKQKRFQFLSYKDLGTQYEQILDLQRLSTYIL